MPTLQRIKSYADIRPGEGKTFAVLFLQCFCTGFATAFYFVFANSNFLKHTAISNLPLGYSLSGILGLILISAYKRISVRRGIVPAYVSCILAYSFLCVLLYAGMNTWQHDAGVSLILAYIAFIFIMPFATMFSLSFSTLYLMVHNLAQSKRLMALVAAGDTVAAIFAYLLVPRLLAFFHNDTLVLLPFVCLFILIALLPVWYLKRYHKEKLINSTKKQAYKRFDLRLFAKDRFYAFFAATTFFSILAVFLADYSYLVSVRYLAVQHHLQTAVIIAWVFSLIKTGELVFSFLSRGIISRHGMRFSLLLLPVLLTVSSLLGVVSNLLFSGISLFLTLFILLSKWNERVIRKGISVPAMKVLYQVTDPAERVKLQTLIDGSLSQVYTIIAGVVLWGISAVYYDSLQPVSLLQVMAIAGMIGFALWVWCSYELFSAYKVRIQKFLQRKHGLKTSAMAAQQAGIVVPGTIKPEPIYLDWHHLVALKANCWENDTREHLLSLVAYYNPKSNMPDGSEAAETICKKMVRIYYNNDSLFSRFLVIWYVRRFISRQSAVFFREVYDISDTPLSDELVAMLNAAGYKPGDEDRFYFVDICQHCIREIIWTEAALDDLKTVDNKILQNGLIAQCNDLKSIMFRLLKVLYDPVMISSVQEHIEDNENETEAYIFALELLENILDEDLKHFVIPVLTDVPYAAKKQHYQQIGFVYSMPVEERLKELIMKSFKLISPYLRQKALEQYYELTGDRTMADAFSLSRLENLSAAANNMLKNTIDDALFYKLKLVNDISDQLYDRAAVVSYYFSNGISTEVRKNWQQERLMTEPFTPDKHTSFVFIDNYCMTVDVLGLALLSKFTKSDHYHKQES